MLREMERQMKGHKKGYSKEAYPLMHAFFLARQKLSQTLWNVSANTGLSESTVSLAERKRYSISTRDALIKYYRDNGVDVESSDINYNNSLSIETRSNN